MKTFYNANIYALEDPKASAFVVEDGHFTALGTDEDIIANFSSHGKPVNLQGKTVWPGLTDAHIHLRLLAESRAMIDCETPYLDECLSRIGTAAKFRQPNQWIRGHGWNQNSWEEGFGTAALLDRICGENPVYLTAKSLHAAWANTQALKLAGINERTPDPPGGEIQRDQSGHPTGILFEAGAMKLVEAVIPTASLQETVRNIELLIPELWKTGLVGVHDFDDEICWSALNEIYHKGQFPLRVRKHIPHYNLETFINANLHTDFGDDWLDLGGVKLFADGALGPQTAAMLKPFDDSSNTGTLLLDADEIFEIGKYAINHGIALAVHAIGDNANRQTLNAFERLRNHEEVHQLHHFLHRIEHVQIIDPADLPRLAMLDIVASVQPIHATSDMVMADRYLGKRAENAYVFQSIVNFGTPIVFGSDAPVESFNPFLGLHAAVTRRRVDGTPGKEGWHPHQRLSISQALYGYSHGPANVSGKGNRLGKIAKGYHADFILLDDDPFHLDPFLLAQVLPVATYIAGICRYRSEHLDIED